MALFTVPLLMSLATGTLVNGDVNYGAFSTIFPDTYINDDLTYTKLINVPFAIENNQISFNVNMQFGDNRYYSTRENTIEFDSYSLKLYIQYGNGSRDSFDTVTWLDSAQLTNQKYYNSSLGAYAFKFDISDIDFICDVPYGLTSTNDYSIISAEFSLNRLSIDGLSGLVQINDDRTYEVVDLGGLMFDMVTMPFSFISQAFDVTLFANTPYSVNISNLLLSLIAISIIIAIITKILPSVLSFF